MVSGTSTLATYNGWTDILTTQKGNPPTDIFDRALLLHECTHALVDVFTGGLKVTRHTDELASYIAQHVYIMRYEVRHGRRARARIRGRPSTAASSPSSKNTASRRSPATARASPSMSWSRCGCSSSRFPTLIMAATQRPSWPGPTVEQINFFLDDAPATVLGESSSVAYETYPDPSDDYLIDVFLEKYTVTDVRGYKGRMKRLRMDFAKCSLARARRSRFVLRRASAATASRNCSTTAWRPTSATSC